MYSSNNFDLSDTNLSLSKSQASSYLGENSATADSRSCSFQSKIILVGDSSVGKTSIINRFTENAFSENYRCTVGVEYKIKALYLDNSTKVEMRIWDTCGGEQYRSLTKQFFRDSDGAILCFDLTSKTSFDHLEDWFRELKNCAPPQCQIFVAGNKSDLEDQRRVPVADIQTFLSSHTDLRFLEVSAKTGTNVVLMFEELASLIAKNNEKPQNEKEAQPKKVYRVENKSQGDKNKSKCC